MNLFKRMSIIAALAASVVSFSSTSAESYGSIRVGVVNSVYDGDTFRASIPSLHPIIGDNIGIRILGIDTPEIRAKCPDEKKRAIAARDFLRNVLKYSNDIVLKDVQRDKYFRIDAVVLVDGLNIGEVMISRGLARPYDGSTKQGWCSRF